MRIGAPEAALCLWAAARRGWDGCADLGRAAGIFAFALYAMQPWKQAPPYDSDNKHKEIRRNDDG